MTNIKKPKKVARIEYSLRLGYEDQPNMMVYSVVDSNKKLLCECFNEAIAKRIVSALQNAHSTN